MSQKSEDLHGSAPDNSNVALLLIDVIGDYEFEDGDKLFENALPAAGNIAALKAKAKSVKIPVIRQRTTTANGSRISRNCSRIRSMNECAARRLRNCSNRTKKIISS